MKPPDLNCGSGPLFKGEGKCVGGSSGMFPLQRYSDGDRTGDCKKKACGDGQAFVPMDLPKPLHFLF